MTPGCRRTTAACLLAAALVAGPASASAAVTPSPVVPSGSVTPAPLVVPTGAPAPTTSAPSPAAVVTPARTASETVRRLLVAALATATGLALLGGLGLWLTRAR